MTNAKYYDGTRLLSMKDIDGNRPEIYICTSNRTAGKTTYFNRLVVNGFLKRKEKFILLYRFKYELDEVADKFFKDIKTLFFPEYTMTSEKQQMGIYHSLFLQKGDGEKEECGYAVSINSADQIKRNSHLFSDARKMLFDEFQSETSHYCKDETTKFISIHQSIARGNGEQVRYLPVYMVGNPVSIINPYYVDLDISARLQYDTKFLKGSGWVLEQGFNESASAAQKESGFNKAFSNNSYINYASEAIYLNDNLTFIERPKGRSRYVCTVKYQGVDYAIREFPHIDIIYIDNSIDETAQHKITIASSDHRESFIMLKRSEPIRVSMRNFFMHGAVRFKDLRCKQMFMKFICLNN